MLRGYFQSVVRVGLDLTPLLGPPTGIHQHTRALLDELVARNDIDVQGWLLTGRGRATGIDVPVWRFRVPAGLAQQTWRFGGFPGRRLVAGNVDVIHGINFLAPPRAGTVVTIHDTTPLAGADLTQPAIAAKAGAIRRLLRSSALIHVPAQGIADELIADHGAEADRVVVVPHGIRPAPTVVPHEGVPNYERYLITVGRTERRKRVPTIVEMLDDLPDHVALVIAGPIGDDENRLASAVRKLDDPNRVVRVTAASDATRNSLIAGSAGLVLASEYEGFGFTPLEAIQLNVPVAATAVGALPDLIGDGFDLVAPGASDLSTALAAATRRALNSAVPQTVRQRVEALRWADTADAMVELYHRART